MALAVNLYIDHAHIIVLLLLGVAGASHPENPNLSPTLGEYCSMVAILNLTLVSIRQKSLRRHFQRHVEVSGPVPVAKSADKQSFRYVS